MQVNHILVYYWLMEISGFNRSNDLVITTTTIISMLPQQINKKLNSLFSLQLILIVQQYWNWGVEEMMACMFSDEESRPVKQLRRSSECSSFGNTNCSLKDRNLAERNRREKMSLRFTALSSLLPPSKKVCQTSLLS